MMGVRKEELPSVEDAEEGKRNWCIIITIIIIIIIIIIIMYTAQIPSVHAVILISSHHRIREI